MCCKVLGGDAHQHLGAMQQAMDRFWHLLPLISPVGSMSVSVPGTHLPFSPLAPCEVWLPLSEVSPCCRFLRVSRQGSICKMASDVWGKAGINEGQQWRTGSVLGALACFEDVHGLCQSVHTVLTTFNL